MIAAPTSSFLTAPDGVRLAYREIGQGRPTVLLHGFSSTAMINWVAPGHAAAIAATGRRVQEAFETQSDARASVKVLVTMH